MRCELINSDVKFMLPTASFDPDLDTTVVNTKFAWDLRNCLSWYKAISRDCEDTYSSKKYKESSGVIYPNLSV